jgi:3-hydroxybutyryl-CoA dehydrogenase
MDYRLIVHGTSRSFPEPHALHSNARDGGTAVLILGDAAAGLRALGDLSRYSLVLIELGNECLGVHTGEAHGEEGGQMLGFARWRLGDLPPSDLIELVRQPSSDPAALAAAQAIFAAAGLQVAVCRDFAGRIVDRLIRPVYNAALRRLDEGLASAADMDTTLRLGLGYPHGPIDLLHRSGLAQHYAVCQALFEAYGEAAYAPARRARVAWQRAAPAPDAAAG